MQDALFGFAGGLGVAAALIHGWLGDSRIVAPLAAAAPGFRFRTLRAVWFLSALYWFAPGALLLAAPFALDAPVARALALAAAFAYAAGAAANAWAFRLRHFGAAILGLAAALSAAAALA